MNSRLLVIFIAAISSIFSPSVSASPGDWSETTITFANQPLIVQLPAKFEMLDEEHPLFSQSRAALGSNFRLAAGYLAKENRSYLVFRENRKLKDYSYSPDRWSSEIDAIKSSRPADPEWEKIAAQIKAGSEFSGGVQPGEIELSGSVENRIIDEAPFHFIMISLTPTDRPSRNGGKREYSVSLETQMYVSYRRVAMVSYSYAADLNEIVSIVEMTKEIVSRINRANPSNTAKTWGLK